MFITFEGIDGAGKSTQASMLAKYLSGKYKAEVVLTHEPGGWEGGGALREMARGGALKHRWSEAFLFMLDRCEHIAQVISPSVQKGKTVLCDRYHDSTLAYQVWGRGLPLRVFDALADMVKFPVPDVTLFFDAPVGAALARASQRSRPDAFEKEGIAFMTRVRKGYITLAEREPDRWVIINCGGDSAAEIFEKTLTELSMKGFFRD